MCALRVTRHTSIRYSSSCHTRVNMGASTFFTAAVIPAFRSARSRGNGPFAHFARNSLCTVTTDLIVWYSNTQNLSPGATVFLLHRFASPSGRNVNYDKKQLTEGKKYLCCSFYLYRFRKYMSYGFLINFCIPGVHYETPCIVRLH